MHTMRWKFTGGLSLEHYVNCRFEMRGLLFYFYSTVHTTLNVIFLSKMHIILLSS